MPGGETQQNTALLEKTVVLKGEVVLSCRTYRGGQLPADRRELDVKPLEYCAGMLSGQSGGPRGSSEGVLDATANFCLA